MQNNSITPKIPTCPFIVDPSSYTPLLVAIGQFLSDTFALPLKPMEPYGVSRCAAESGFFHWAKSTCRSPTRLRVSGVPPLSCGVVLLGRDMLQSVYPSMR